MSQTQVSAYLAVADLNLFMSHFGVLWNYFLHCLYCINTFHILQFQFFSLFFFPFLQDQKFRSVVGCSAFLCIPVLRAFWSGHTNRWITWNQAVSSFVLLPTSPEVLFIPSVKMAMSAQNTKGIKLYFLLQNHLELSGNIPLLFAFQGFDPLEKPHPLSWGLTSLLTQHYKKADLNWS